VPYNFENITDSHDRSFKREKRSGDLVMSVEDYSKLLSAVQNRPANRRKKQRDYLVFVLMGNMGLRVSEVAILKFSDFIHVHDPEFPYARVTNLKQEDPRATKDIYLHADIVKIVKRFLKMHKRKDQPYLFPGTASSVTPQDSGHISPRQISRAFQHYCRSCRFDRKYSTHCLRHMYASIVEERTHCASFLRDQLGHSTMPGYSQVQSRYVHTMLHTRRKCIEKIGAIL